MNINKIIFIFIFVFLCLFQVFFVIYKFVDNGPYEAKFALSTFTLALVSIIWLPICMEIFSSRTGKKILRYAIFLIIVLFLFGCYFMAQLRFPLQLMGSSFIESSLLLTLSVVISRFTLKKKEEKRGHRGEKGSGADLED